MAVISMLAEGASILAVERITGIHEDTIGRLALRVGQACKKIMDEKMRGLSCKQIVVFTLRMRPSEAPFGLKLGDYQAPALNPLHSGTNPKPAATITRSASSLDSNRATHPTLGTPQTLPSSTRKVGPRQVPCGSTSVPFPKPIFVGAAHCRISVTLHPYCAWVAAHDAVKHSAKPVIFGAMTASSRRVHVGFIWMCLDTARALGEMGKGAPCRKGCVLDIDYDNFFMVFPLANPPSPAQIRARPM